jgi:hypothetical protein
MAKLKGQIAVFLTSMMEIEVEEGERTPESQVPVRMQLYEPETVRQTINGGFMSTDNAEVGEAGKRAASLVCARRALERALAEVERQLGEDQSREFIPGGADPKVLS